MVAKRNTGSDYFQTKAACVPLLPVNQAQELFSRLSCGTHGAQHAACGCCSPGLLNTSHHHAEVAGLNNHSDTLRLEHFGQCKGNLFREAFLDLETTGEHFSNTCKF